MALNVSLGTWSFGSLLLVFFVWVFWRAPDKLPEWRHRILALFSALLAGLFGYFLTGDLGVQIEGGKATGGFALFVVVLYWWFSPAAPIGVKADTD